MKITLTGFRCYRNTTTFEFQDDGIILISGPSGVGKSTILMAINFALYNHGTKLCSYGETKCKVQLIYKNIKIERTNKPNRLVVNDVYEDAVAQSMINDLFGKNFDVTGYIPQNTTESFLSKSAPAKRDFLESVKFDTLLLSEKKEKLDTIIKTNKETLDKTIGKLELAKSLLPSKPEVVPFPLKGSIDRAIKNENIKLSNADFNIKKITKEIKNKEHELNQLKVTNTFIAGKDENLKQICDQLANLTIDLDKHTDFIGDDKLALYQKHLKHMKSNTLLQRLILQRDNDIQKMESMKQTELQDFLGNISSIKTKLWTDYSKDDTLSLIQNNKEVLKDISKVSSLRSKKGHVKDIKSMQVTKETLTKTIEDLNKELQSIDVLLCPQCEAHLLYNDDNLVISPYAKSISSTSTDDLKKQIHTTKSQLKQVEYDIIKYTEVDNRNKECDVEIESIISEYDEELDGESIKDDLVHMEAYLQSQLSLEKKLRDYEQCIAKELFSPSYQSCRKDLDKLNKQISALEEAEDNDGDEESILEDDEETIRDIITDQQQKSRRIKEIKQQLVTQEKIKQNVTIQKEEYMKKHMSSTASENDLIHTINMLKNDVNVFMLKQEEHRQNLKKIEVYLDYKKAEAVYNTQFEMITSLEKQQDVDSGRYTLAKVLKNELLEVEHIALTNIINDINAYANVFIQEFFDDAIFVNLSCFKEDKKKNEKPQINIDVKYRDQTCNMTSLSGGEYARVNLAFTLSLAKIFKTPLLLLDETLASLDEDASDIVFASIKKHFRNIPVISILHQVTSEGDFDQVLKL